MASAHLLEVRQEQHEQRVMSDFSETVAAKATSVEGHGVCVQDVDLIDGRIGCIVPAHAQSITSKSRSCKAPATVRPRQCGAKVHTSQNSPGLTANLHVTLVLGVLYLGLASCITTHVHFFSLGVGAVLTQHCQ